MKKRERLKLALAILRGDIDAAVDFLSDEITEARLNEGARREAESQRSWFAEQRRMEFERRPTARELSTPNPGEQPAASWRHGMNWANSKVSTARNIIGDIEAAVLNKHGAQARVRVFRLVQPEWGTQDRVTWYWLALRLPGEREGRLVGRRRTEGELLALADGTNKK